MKKFYALPLAALLFAACSESTAPETGIADLTPVFGQNPPAEPPPPVCTSSDPDCATWDDATGIAAASNYGISANATTTTSPTPASETFLGRFATETVLFSLTNAASGPVTITFNLYTIGQWHGQPRRAAPHLWELATQCGTGSETRVVYASFANKDGGAPQSYPNNYPTKNTSDAFTGSSARNALDYLNGTGSNATAFYSTRTGATADVTYNIQRTVQNACAAGEFRFVMRAHNLTGGIATHSWGIDNLSIRQP